MDHAELEVGAGYFRRDPIKPVQQGDHFAALEHGLIEDANQTRDRGPIPRREGMLHCIPKEISPFVPSAGALMKLVHFESAETQPVPQQVGEQVMVAVPSARRVERNDEQVSLLQPFQQFLAVCSICDRVAQGT